MRYILIIILSLLVLSACRDDRQEDFFLSEGRVKIHRYDRLQFEASALNSFTSLQKMNMNFPHATKLLIEDVLALGSVDDEKINDRLCAYYSDTSLVNLMLDVEDKYKDLGSFEKELTKGFSEALDNDLNTSLALTCVYDVLKADADDATKLYVIGEFDKVLSLDLTKVPESNKADADDDFAKEVEELIAQRTKARAEKDWATADAIRDKLKEMKVVVKDTKDGIEWHVEG